MQILGIVLVLVSSTMVGAYFGGIHGYRAKDLKEIKKALIVLKQEIEYTLTPLAQALLNTAAKVDKPASDIFAEAGGLIEQKTVPNLALEKSLNNASAIGYLTKEDVQQLNSLGKTLGYLDKNLQLNTIDLTINYLQEKIDEQIYLNNKNKKLYQTLGILGGILLVVILI